MLLPLEQVIERARAQELAARLAAAEWQDGRQSAGSQAAGVKANLQLDDRSPLAVELRGIVLDSLQAKPLFVAAALPRHIFPPKFNCYRHGGHYGLHVDAALMTLPAGAWMRTDISATLFLSAPQDYAGGELVIETRYGAREVKLDAGDLILYPSTSLHEVRPVTEGARICSFFWIESLVRDSTQREMLFDLDQSIQVLTVDRGSEDAEVKRLTGLYHNLLRGWAGG